MESEGSLPCPPLVPILSQMNLVHIHTLIFFKIHYNVSLPTMPRSTKWSLPSSWKLKVTNMATTRIFVVTEIYTIHIRP